MTQLIQRFGLLLVLFLLLTSCAMPGGNTQAPPQATPAATTTQVSQTIDVCPQPLTARRGCLTPHAIRQAYGVEALIQKGFTGKGQAIIDIVSFGSPTLKEDMDLYNRTFDLPPLDLQIISPLNVKESDPFHDKEGWAGETTLDVQIIHAIAPDAKIVVLTSPVAETEGTDGLPEFRQLIQYAIDHQLGTIFSNSWGTSELTLQDKAGQQELQQWNTLLQKATTQQGMTFIASSGDHGATDYTDKAGRQLAKVQATSFAASSPWITSVGGTTLTRFGSTTQQERVWNSGDAASGGGFSKIYPMPDYQKLLPANMQQQFKGQRGVPDVAAVGDPATGLAMYSGGTWSTAGGTSASAPLWAGLMAIANQMAGHPLGFINPTLYKLGNASTYAQDFHDITTGNNNNRVAGVQGFDAVQGWDAATGLGTPAADHLIPDLISAMK